jgi:hypothetical protein
MGIGKIFIGVVLLVIGIAIWFMLSSPEGALTQVLFSTPSARYDFTQTFASFQFIYFIAMFGIGIGMILWGTQS